MSAPAACGGAPVRDVAYQALPGVAAGLQALDLYPPCPGVTPAPVVIWVHGGAWAIGDKANSMADKVALWNGAGYAVVSVNYRLSPETGELDPGRVRHPLHAQDVATAIAWVHEHIAEHGGDPGRIALRDLDRGPHDVIASADGLAAVTLPAVATVARFVDGDEVVVGTADGAVVRWRRGGAPRAQAVHGGATQALVVLDGDVAVGDQVGVAVAVDDATGVIVEVAVRVGGNASGALT